MLHGIDVSSHQRTIRWEQAAEDQVDFAIIRAGYGRTNVDDYFERNMEGALRQSLPVGVYWFSYALNRDHAREEAEKCVSLIRRYEIRLPVFYDFEYDTVRYARQQGVTLNKSSYNQFAKAFCDYVESQGYRAGIYYNLDYKRNWVDMRACGEYVQWLAHYTSAKASDCELQQYSSSGEVAGISGPVDVNWLFDETLLGRKTATAKPDGRAAWTRTLQEALNASYNAGLAVDGSAGPLTQAAILKHYLYYKLPTLKNSHVRWVQQALRELGYGLAVDGSYGPESRDTVRRFQKEKDLETDGYAGPATHLKLLELV